MAEYKIFEENIDRLEKRIKSIGNKCKKYGFDFHYERIGETFEQVEVNGEERTLRYIIVDVSGVARHNDWEFIATIDHSHSEANVIRQFKTDIEVPERYFHTAPICEHCGTSRTRKDTYLVHNTVTDEWKQVGKSCLKEFTQGLDAQQVASYISLFDEVIQGEAVTPGSDHGYYNPVVEVIAASKELVNHLGYIKSPNPYDEDYDPERDAHPTKVDVNIYLNLRNSQFCKYDWERMMNAGVSEELTKEDTEFAKEAIEWIKNQDTDGNAYLTNLKTICSEEYIGTKDFGFAVSLVPTYYRYLDKERRTEERKAKHEKDIATSEYVGEVGEKVILNNSSIRLTTSFEGRFGETFVYAIEDENGNVFTWFASVSLDLEDDKKYTITGTVKDHKEYRGVKQTYLTRCKVK